MGILGITLIGSDGSLTRLECGMKSLPSQDRVMQQISSSETLSFPVEMVLRISAVDYFSRSTIHVSSQSREDLCTELSSLFEKLSNGLFPK